MEDELLNLGAKVIRKAEKQGAQQIEAYLSSKKQIRIQVEKSAIKTAEKKLDTGCGIRAVNAKRLGFAYASTINSKDIQACITEAVTLAKVSLPDPDFHTLPAQKTSYNNVDGIFDSDLDQLSSEHAIELILRAVDACEEELKNKKAVIEAGLTIDSTVTVVTNSLGISGVYRETLIDLSADPTIKELNSQASSFEFQISRNLNKIDPEWIGKTAAKNTTRLLNPKSIDGGQLPVIFTPMAIEFLFQIGIAKAFNAEEIQMGRSYLVDYINQEIASEQFQITDNATLPNGNQSRPFDAEGYPSQRTEIITKGVLSNFLHNSYTANKANLDNTGNASRASYQNMPVIAPSNFVIMPGKGDLADLITEIRKGIVCRFTADRPNLTTGDLSALVMEGYYIDKGEIQYPLKNTLIGINMRDFFQRISLIGADTRSLKTTVTPSIVIESAKITSGK